LLTSAGAQHGECVHPARPSAKNHPATHGRRRAGPGLPFSQTHHALRGGASAIPLLATLAGTLFSLARLPANRGSARSDRSALPPHAVRDRHCPTALKVHKPTEAKLPTRYQHVTFPRSARNPTGSRPGRTHAHPPPVSESEQNTGIPCPWPLYGGLRQRSPPIYVELHVYEARDAWLSVWPEVF